MKGNLIADDSNRNRSDISAKQASKGRFVFLLLSVCLYSLGVSSLFFYSNIAHRTYISENALMPGGALIEFNDKSLQLASRLSRDTLANKTNLVSFYDVAEHLKTLLDGLGLESAVQWCNSTKNSGETFNVYSILRSAKGLGTESIVISAQYKKDEIVKEGQVTSVGMGMALMKHLQTKKWLAKDVILVVSEFNDNGNGIKCWLSEYYYSNARSGDLLPRAGIIQAALNIDITPSDKFDHLMIKIEGANGQLPNLDLINTARAVGRRIGITDEQLVLFEKYSTGGRLLSYLPNIPVTVHTTFKFMINQALGIPTGDHGVFNIYRIDAITIKNGLGINGATHSMISFGKIIEGTIRSLNNLIEHLHQSFYYYLLSAPYLYTSIGEYMITLALILLGFALRILFGILSLKYDARTIHALCLVGVLQINGALIFSLPFFVPKVFELLRITCAEVYIIQTTLLGAGLLIVVTFFYFLPAIDCQFNSSTMLNSNNRATIDAFHFKTVAFLPSMLFLSTLSLLNFSFCLFSAIMILPIYTFLYPIEVNSTASKIWRIFQVIILAVFSPLGVLMIFMYSSGTEPISILQDIIRQYQQFSNLLYPFLTLIYLPLNLCFWKLLTSSTISEKNKYC